MSVKLEGSCRCGAVHFSVMSHPPYPSQLCYCSICRKTAGGGGFAINLMGDARTLEITGRKTLRIYHAEICDDEGNCEVSTGERPRPAGAAVAHPPDAKIQAELGRAGGWAA